MGGAHARFSPSSAERVMSCPASLKLNESVADSASYDAAWGTLGHYLSEMAMVWDKPTRYWLGQRYWLDQHGVVQRALEPNEVLDDAPGWVIQVCEEMADAAQQFVDYCLALPGTHYTERRVDISRWTPESGQFGTCDFASVNDSDLYVVDAKFGKGVRVEAARNPQLALYALGFYDEFDWMYGFKRVHITVHQPRLDSVTTWTLGVDELLRFGAQIKDAFVQALAPSPPFGPSEKACKFCKVAATCSALRDKVEKDAALVFDDISEEFDPPNVNALPLDDVIRAWRLRPLYNIRMAAVEDFLMQRLLAGDVPGLKLVEGKSNRAWADEGAAASWLQEHGVKEEEMYERKMLSPAKAEKKLAKPVRKEMSTLVIKPRGAPAIVEADDPRPDYREVVTDAFEDEDLGL